ncbi:MAG: hypothetical protein HFACDABA_00379 [Anaerolineales bacterium]|nr:hypothetical protein [Anaerolineales bacterium]
MRRFIPSTLLRASLHLSRVAFIILLSACQPATETPAATATATSTSTITPGPSPTATLTPTSTPQPTASPRTLGPTNDKFPAGINPLSGLPVADPSLLDIPALLISISHFPATARPQAGLSFAPFVYEISITEGATRHLAVFYGKFPEPEIPLTGDCDIRTEPVTRNGLLLGNRVWLDGNADGRVDDWEAGVGGVCVNLRGESANAILQQTTTDSNGYYAFNVTPGKYVVEFVKPAEWKLTAQDAGDESADSDADASTGLTRPVVVNEADILHVDAGLVAPNYPASGTLPLAQVGPVRSGRLVYADLAASYANSCLIYAFASEEVLEQLPQCAFVTHGIQGGGYMLEMNRMQAIAADHARKHADKTFNYASNLFSGIPPTGGAPALRMTEYWAYLNQSGWLYDAASRSYWRTVDDSTEANAGIQRLEVDRLNGRQLQFENVIVVFAEVDVVSPTNLDIHLEQGSGGPALIFRDGMKYNIRWSTRSTASEQHSGQREPMQFLNADGSPFPLKPGRTWVIVLSPFSLVNESAPGGWVIRYARVNGEQ